MYTSRYQPPRLLASEYYSSGPSVSHHSDRPAKKQQTNVLTPVDPNKGAAHVVLRRTVSSLVPPDLSLRHSSKSPSKAQKDGRPTRSSASKSAAAAAAKSAHRLSSSAASIHSTTSSVRSRKRKYYHVPCLTSMPCEILDEVFSHLTQKDLHAVLLCNKYLADSAAPALYAAPRFASTYRFAQFVSLITHSPPLANLVRELNLSNIATDVPEELPLAGWRDWKYRNDPLHTIRKETDFKIRKGWKAVASAPPPKVAHPLPSPFLTQYHTCRDVPIGAVLHIITACPRLSIIDLSYVPIAADYAVLPVAAKHSGYKPTAFTNLLFVSDVPKAYTWRSEETKVVNAGVELVDAITKLRSLKTFKARRGVWLTTGIANKFVKRCRTVGWDFRECGGYKGEKWAVRGSSEYIEGLLGE
ncbi:hypothetical protein DRE_04798 [Drechslerella stenobrocha 248]|uniref:F-box domain-containing protein n=1 Tax=Drechslerella stenobrocha 248 TaxID=1043628 RepID=W7IAD8_9PEZI|nr:hypothetical protein DRE_04798 [Drechslerella stenobrocha 248]